MPSRTMRMDSLVRAGEPPIRVMSAYHTRTGSHDHEFYELVYVTEGFCLQDSSHVVTLLMEGDIFVVKPGVSHKYIGNRVTHIYNCVFMPSVLGDDLQSLAMLPGLDRLFAADSALSIPRIHLTLNERKAVLKLLNGMADECTAHDTGWSARIKGQLICLLVEYARAYITHVGSDTDSSAYSAYVAQALETVGTRYGDCGLTVHEIAAQVGVSADYLSRQFRQITGIAAQEYLRRYRFARAMELLQGDSPVSEVASQVGFRSLSHFSREFKREMGITPSQYKAQNE